MVDFTLYRRLLVSGALAFAFALSPLLAQEEKKEEEPKDAPADEKAPAADSTATDAAGAQEPSAFWIIDFELKNLRMISPTEGVGAGKVYWYMLYTLENKAKEDREVSISIRASSDQDKHYVDSYLPGVEKAIEKKENKPLWGKADEFAILAKRKPSDPKYRYVTIKAGEKRSCVAVFNQLDPGANKITIDVAGLSNEIHEVVNKDDGARFLEERVRELRFERPGDEYAMTLDSFKLVGKDWVKKQITAPAGGAASAGDASGSAAK